MKTSFTTFFLFQRYILFLVSSFCLLIKTLDKARTSIVFKEVQSRKKKEKEHDPHQASCNGFYINTNIAQEHNS